MNDAVTLDIISSVRGKLLRVEDMREWSPQKFEEFFVFMDFFWDNDKMLVKTDTVRMLEEYSKSGSNCAEHMTRIDMPIGEEEPNTAWKQKFRLRLGTMYRNVKRYLTEINPAALSAITAKRCRFKPQYEWMRELYSDDGTVKFVAQDIPEEPESDEDILRQAEALVPVSHTSLVSTDPNLPIGQRLVAAIEKVVSVYEAIAGSITMEEINALPIKDKLAALQKLSYIHAATGKAKIPQAKFTQINIGTASKEDLERSLLSADGDDGDDL